MRVGARAAWATTLAVGVAAVAGALTLGRLSYAPMPREADLLNPARLPAEQNPDLTGSSAARVDAEFVRIGREAFYKETFGNEVFLTDIMGLIDGGVSVTGVSAALLALAGRGTSNLQVRVARDVQVGERTYRRGDLIQTGLDVPRGGLFPIGIKAFYDRGRVRMGITCALCHSAVEPGSGKVVEGAPNADLNVGLLMALSSNPAAYFMHTGVTSLDPYRTDPTRTVSGAAGSGTLPEPGRLAADVRAMLGAWPSGSFDSSPDLVNNPASTPSSFTRAAHPYGWSGHASIGPFRGLSALNNNVHGLNSDTTGQYLAAPTLFGIDPEVYLGTLLQEAPDRGFRFNPARGGPPPSALLSTADPTPGSPGVNSYAVLPSYPRANYVTSNGLVATRTGEPVGYANDAMSAFQNGLRPPPAAAGASAETVATGRAVFERAGCASCHGGPAFTNNRVLPVAEVGTEPTRARSFARTEATVAPPELFAPGTPFPVPAGARLVDVSVPEPAQVKLAWAHGGGAGGYKVPSLVGLAWTAPYLHDGGVAVGPEPERRPGVDATLFAGIAPDPANSLRALIDRELRNAVVAANVGSATARTAHVTGDGHAYWADEAAGFTDAERDALVRYLLSIDRPAVPAEDTQHGARP